MSRIADADTADADRFAAFLRDAEREIPDPVERAAVADVALHLGHFVRWAARPLLFWPGRARPGAGEPSMHAIPSDLLAVARAAGATVDRRSHGPAIMAFELAEGERPARSKRPTLSWPIHHIYDGEHPYPGKTTFRAAKDGQHCTQAAGLVAAHPVAQAMADEYARIARFLRAHAFDGFGYDPDGVFSQEAHDDRGFVPRA